MHYPNPPRCIWRWLASAIATILILCLATPPTQLWAQGAANQVCIGVSANLVSVDAGQAALLDALLGSLLDHDLNLGVNDLNALAQGQIDLDDLLGNLQLQEGLLDLDSTLGADLTLNALLDAAIAAAEASLDTTLAAALENLQLQLGSLTDTIQIGDLLDLNAADGSLVNAQINALDLTTAIIQLYSFDNVNAPTIAMSLSGADSGLGAVIGSIAIMAQVLAAPTIVCGTTGLQFAAPPIRLLIQSDLIDADLDLVALDGVLEGLLGLLTDIELRAELGQLSLVADIAGGAGTLSSVNLAVGAVTAQVTPGLAALYLGQIDSSLAFSRTHSLSAGDFDYAPIGSVAISVTDTLNTTLFAADLNVKSNATADLPSPIALNFTAPFPETLAAAANLTVITDLVTELVGNLDLQVDLDLGPLLTPLIGTALLDGLDSALVSELPLGLDLVLDDLLEPALLDLGLGVGGLQMTVFGSLNSGPDLAIAKSHSGDFTAGANHIYTIQVQNVGDSATFGPATVFDTLPAGMSYLSHTGGGWTLSGAPSSVVTLTHAGGVQPGAATDPLVLTVNVAAQAAGSVTNLATVSTVGDTNSANNLTTDLTLINGVTGGGNGDGVCIVVGANLLTLDSTQSELLNALLSGLLDTDLNLSMDNINGLAQTQIDLDGLLDTLQATLGVADVDGVLNADLTLTQLLDALEVVLAGDVDGLAALDVLGLELSGLTGPIKLGDLLDLDLDLDGAGAISINGLDLLTGLIQLYNFDNVLQPTVQIELDGSAIGLGSLVGHVQLAAQVLAPPTFVCGPVGLQFASAPLRLHLTTDLVDLDLDLDDLDATLEGLLAVALNVEIEATLGQLEIVADVGGGIGVITAIDAIGGVVTAQVTPGLVTLLVGDVDGATIFDRSHALSLTNDLDFGQIGSLHISITDVVLGLPVTDITVAIEAKTFADGSSNPVTLTFTAPFPETQHVGGDLSADLATELLTNLELDINTSLGALLDPLLNSTILPALKTILQPQLSTVLDGLLAGLVNPLLDELGIKVGDMTITVLGTPSARPDLAIGKHHIGNFIAGRNHTYVIEVSNVGPGATFGPITVVDVLPSGLTFAGYSGTGWSAPSQAGNTVTFSRADAVATGAALPLLSLTVSVAPQFTGAITNVATVATSGDITVGNNTDFDLTLVVAGNNDTDGDTVPDPVEDTDGDGDNDDDDTDGDGTPDYQDTDDDNDTIPTRNEDEDGNGDPTNDDSDGDGLPNYLDPDDDNDGVLTRHENPDPNGDGNTDDAQDSDGDGTPDYLDTDDDGDGIFTRHENADPNGDGNPNDAQNTDNEGNPDYLDPDDDNDTKPTSSENADPNGDHHPADAVDTDGDNTPDYLDPNDGDGPNGDNDGDGLTNGQETTIGTNPNNRDSDGDGLFDNHEVGPNLNSPFNHDGDGFIDALDPNDDNDTKPTITENADPNGDGNPVPDAVDTDGDTIVDYLDPDDGTSPGEKRQQQLLPLIMLGA